MRIQNIRNKKKEISKDEWKKRIVQVGAVSLGLLLTLGSVKANEIHNNYKNISLSDCKVIVENCPDGSVKHHFVDRDYDIDIEECEQYDKLDYEFSSVTKDNFTVSSSYISYNTEDYFCYDEMPKTYGRYIFDYNVPYYIFSTTDLSLPECYSFEKLYSINDLKELEEKLNNSIYNNKKEKERYWINFLCLVEIDGNFMCFDFSDASKEITETTDEEDVTKLRNVYYIPSIGNDLVNLKISSGENAIADETANFNRYRILDNHISDNFVIEGITSLNKTIQKELNGKQIIIKDLAYYLTSEQKDSDELSKEEIMTILNKLNSPENILKQKIANAANALTERNENIEVYYSVHANQLEIHKKEGISKKEISNEFYEGLNKIIEENDIKRLCFYNIDSTFDLGRINTTKISRKIFYFKNFQETLDCSSLTGELEFHFTNMKGKIASEILSTCDTKQAYIYWEEKEKYTSELSDFLKAILCQNKEIHLLDIKERNKENYKGITQEEFNLLSKLNVEDIRINANGFKKPINLDLELNPKIQFFSISAYETYDRENDIYKNSEIANVKIKSENKDLFCHFCHTDITKNTRFSLPNFTQVWLHNLDCADIRAFEDLKNVRYLEFKEDLHADGGADQRGEMIYDAEEMPTNPFGAIPYTNYNKFLKDLEYFFKLKSLRERMNLAPAAYSYYDEINIGAYATLENDYVDVYKSLEDLHNKQNSTSSYFGNKELRVISSIGLAKNESKVNVNNMEDCEYYLNEGYEIIGVTFVNQYSTFSKDYEMFVAEEDIKLMRIPFE